MIQAHEAELLRGTTAQDIITHLPEGRWFGVVGEGDVSFTFPNGLELSKMLRRDVYVDEYGWAHEDEVDSRIETDMHDTLSTHVALIDQDQGGEHRASATVRYINKSSAELPVETEFGVVLPDDSRAMEVSRLISRHPDKRVQMLGCVLLVAHTVGTLVREEMDGYAIIEPKLLRMVSGMGMSAEQISPVRVFEEYGGTENFAVKIDGPKSLERSRAMSKRKNRFIYHRLFDVASKGSDLDLLYECEDALRIHNERQAA